MIEQVALLESLITSGLARGRMDTEAMAVVYASYHRPQHVLEPAPVNLPALLWAFDELPSELGHQDTVWVVGEDVIETGSSFSRIGPTEWACAGGFPLLRKKALAVAVLAASSRQLREATLGEEALGDIAAELAYSKLSEGSDMSEVAVRLALALGVDKAVMLAAVARQPSLIERIVRLAQHPQLQVVKTRGITRTRHTERAEGLWRELLAGLASLGADTRPLIIWVAPLWAADLVTPYVREVRPLLGKWASSNAALANLGELVERGDEDAVYLCANLLTLFDREVRDERESSDQTVGVFTLHDSKGERMAKVIDCARLEANAIDPRIGDIAKLSGEAPLVLLLNEADPDIGYAFSRLLAEVSAEFLAISVCAGAVGAPGLQTFVAGASAAHSASGTFVFAAPAPGGDHLRPLALPDVSYLELFGVFDADAAFEEHRVQQDAFAAALWRGDLPQTSVSQRFWIDAASEVDYLPCKRAHLADAIAHWRAFLGVDAAELEAATDQEALPSEDDPGPPPEPSPERPKRGLAPGNPRDMPSGTFRFRV